MGAAWWKPREERRGVLLPARMRDADGWHDVTICNVSSRGLMVKASPPPRTGSFVEVRKADVCIVGQVKWAKESAFGLRTQDRIDIEHLCSAKGPAAERSPGNDRRQADRPPERKPDPVDKAEMNRLFGRIFEYAVLVSAVVVVAVVLSQFAVSALRAPLSKASAALATAGEPR